MILLVCHGRGDAVPERVRDTHQRRATPQRRHTKVYIHILENNTTVLICLFVFSLFY